MGWDMVISLNVRKNGHSDDTSLHLARARFCERVNRSQAILKTVTII